MAQGIFPTEVLNPEEYNQTIRDHKWKTIPIDNRHTEIFDNKNKPVGFAERTNEGNYRVSQLPTLDIEQVRNFGRQALTTAQRAISNYGALKASTGPAETPSTPVAASTPSEPKQTPPNEHMQKLSDAMPQNCTPDAAARNIQALLKADDPNVDLGRTGPKGDGVDNQFGPKTKAALTQYIQKYGGDTPQAKQLLDSINGIGVDGNNFGQQNGALNTAMGDAQKNNLLPAANPGAPTTVPDEPKGPKHHIAHGHRPHHVAHHHHTPRV